MSEKKYVGRFERHPREADAQDTEFWQTPGFRWPEELDIPEEEEFRPKLPGTPTHLFVYAAAVVANTIAGALLLSGQLSGRVSGLVHIGSAVALLLVVAMVWCANVEKPE